jgi:lysozyme
MYEWKEIAIPLVKSWEAYRAKAYLPTPDDVPTIGYGRTDRVELGDIANKEFEEQYLEVQLERTAQALEKELGTWSWSMYPTAWQASLISLAYNVDKDVVGQLKRSKAMKALIAWQWEEFLYEAFDEHNGFTKQNGKTLVGLVRRRKAEERLFNMGNFFTMDMLHEVLN